MGHEEAEPFDARFMLFEGYGGLDLNRRTGFGKIENVDGSTITTGCDDRAVLVVCVRRWVMSAEGL